MGFGEPGAPEVESWPPLLDALARAGLHDLRIYLEFGTPEGHSRYDAPLIGERGPKDLVAVVVVWATHPGGVEQVGCVYTAQGIEYDDAGVIFGPELVRRDGAVGGGARGEP
ncbi:DNA/RNA helicase domain-containing protein [Nocardiopsis sp. NPDC049922]|uniref:DNA/RNA helicase domain-containing protein n=1 Tax=Nocardiopsis sp. NPDC049922 TaxID=3155157 RepID=UPI0034041139